MNRSIDKILSDDDIFLVSSANPNPNLFSFPTLKPSRRSKRILKAYQIGGGEVWLFDAFATWRPVKAHLWLYSCVFLNVFYGCSVFWFGGVFQGFNGTFYGVSLV